MRLLLDAEGREATDFWRCEGLESELLTLREEEEECELLFSFFDSLADLFDCG